MNRFYRGQLIVATAVLSPILWEPVANICSTGDEAANFTALKLPFARFVTKREAEEYAMRGAQNWVDVRFVDEGHLLAAPTRESNTPPTDSQM
ncbi:MAG TPA: hypothetical protein VNL14_19910 [Candidatus Acidoferrales bacterium]|nr:hypothetical protein [Candidatus Acidoferrales bacterium]